MQFEVQLDVFRGPLELLFLLVRRHELDVAEIPLAEIVRQVVDRLLADEQVDINAVGEFVALASALVELKSAQVLPVLDEQNEEEPEEARKELVRHLLEYKQYRDAATMLEERGRWWQQRYTRQSIDLPPRVRNLAEEPLHEVELWDLVSAFARILRDSEATRPASIVYDDTPIHVYMARVFDRVKHEGRVSLESVLWPGINKAQIIGLLLAILELVALRCVRIEQEELFGRIWLSLHPEAPEDLSARLPSLNQQANGSDSNASDNQ